MIVYHQAFDLYHTVYRMLQLLSRSERSDFVELERIRIWDFYLLFPDKLHSISLTNEEKDVRKYINQFVRKQNNPYEEVLDTRKMFEKIRPYQMTAIKCLASYGLINKDYLDRNRVKVISKDKLNEYITTLVPLTIAEVNVISLMTSHFALMSLYGPTGLKNKSKLLESRYDA